MKTGSARRRRQVETADFLAMLERLIRAAGHRVAEEDPEQLANLITVKYVLDEAILRAVAGQRANEITWQAIGEATGTTRQAAIMKWSRLVADGVDDEA